ncbi:hypothetical protein [Salegentibacter salarius]|uniref:TonB-dependent receptor plug domain-containing protein n=1 Tax=Salegentibacter salarius TaxID=435906 RepID=A0A2N0U329_9FLAO|nr:hypothetical protein [Salegentibacter salarius]OEY71245.1 hypothetical protein BHS39_07155 [Salegentibacter salarius]PKD21399.1 hypothetical protein APR40_07150 [Salegentibacter salarius]SLJ92842.1 hypothetical protein SAMN05660445_01345 [Salegentibacter salarius]
MNKKIFIVFLACLGLNLAYSQGSSNIELLQKEIPKEQVYLHLNSSLLFSGEKLLYKFYSINAETQKLSKLSKVGWVVLVNSDKEIVFQHKLNLEEGQSYSDFFIPSDLRSGAYKILGYTSWMLNEENYFEQDIQILNPYQKNNEGLILQENPESTSEKNTKEAAADLELKLNKTSFSTREEVVLDLEHTTEILGDFSISVRRIDSFSKPTLLKSTNFNKLYRNKNWNLSDNFTLPEIRGSLIKGRISANDNSGLKSKNLIVSFPGEESQVKIVSIDDKGEFSFIINNELTVDELLLQLTDYNQNDYKVELFTTAQPDFSSLNFEKPIVQIGFKDYILEKSINNQIENAYSATKADRTVFPKDEGYFFGQELLKFNLDDYTRFPEVTQTFVEIIEFGRVRRNQDGTHSIMVRNQNINGEFTLPALLIVDGVVVQNHDKLVSFDAEKIESIGILRSKYFFGPAIYQGVVMVETKDGDFPEVFRENYIKSKLVAKAQIPKKYYSPNYKNEELNRIPDYRTQLWWNPNIDSGDSANGISFYTSDLKGKFEINLQGFTEQGQPVSIIKTFKVE